MPRLAPFPVVIAWIALAAAAAGADLAALAVPLELPTPARPGSGEPCLAVAPDGTVFLSWFERRDSTRHALKLSRLEGRRWSAPTTVAEGDSFFVNWADFPVLAALDRRRLMIAWPWRSGSDPYAYEVRIASSRDGGRTWSRPVVPHRDRTPTEHGFVTLIPEGDGVRAVWLDGRKFAEKKPEAMAQAAPSGHDDHGGGEMTLRSAWLGLDGSLAGEAELDERVCECCQTGGAATGSGAAIAYRDRGEDEVRDVSIVRLDGGRWSEPMPVHRDGWKIEGCPVNGPAVDAVGERLAVAWFSMPGDTAQVQVAFSVDGGRTFGEPVRVDGGQPIGRADLLLLEDGSALVSWLETGPAEKEGLIQVRRVREDGAPGPATTVARTASMRASGFPRMVRSGKRVIFAWTMPGEVPQVRVAEVSL